MRSVTVSADHSPRRVMDDEIVLLETSITTSVAQVAGNIKREWRRQIRAAGLGNRLAGTVQDAAYPTRTVSANAAGDVFTKADEIIGAHESGALIRSKTGAYLAIPMPAARGRLPGGGKVTPARYAAARGIDLKPVRTRGGLFLVGEGRLTKRGKARGKARLRLKSGAYGKGAATVFLFHLVPQAQLPKRLDLLPAADKEAALLAGIVLRNHSRLR